MHDTLQVFGARLPELQKLYQSNVAPELSRRGARVVSKAPDVLFTELTDDIRRAAQISAERGLSPEAIRSACRSGFDQVFG